MSKSTPNNKLIQEKFRRLPQLNGIYKGVIRDTYDDSRTGMVLVHIDSLGYIDKQDFWYPCFWTSPFAGSTDPTQIFDELEEYEGTQKSYGMWMIPPDVNNQVIVAFGDSIGKFGYVLGCLFSDKMNHMVPGMPYGRNYGDPGLRMPVAEKNAKDGRETNNDVERPVHVDMAEAIVKQGLINDPIRGAGTGGGRRESPSEVFGILTPGPRGKNPGRSKEQNYHHRSGGHQFVMDDNYNNRMIRLRTAKGNQILMDDVGGSIYMINSSGTAWFELSSKGDVNVYCDGSINMRSKGNFNIRADQNVNIEAGQDVKIKAAGDNVAGNYLGIPSLSAFGVPPLGTGGNIRFEAAADLSQHAALNVQTTAAGGDVDISSGGRIAATANGVLGINLNSAQGPTKIQSTRETSVFSGAGFNVTTSAPVSVQSPQILLNSGGTPATPALPFAATAPRIGTTKQKDAGTRKPFFDRDAALRGRSATRGGDREGTKNNIDTIVSVLVTAEPYKGHAQFKSSFGGPPVASQEIINSLPQGAVDLSGIPADVNTPEGFKKGVGYVDQAGEVIGEAEQTADQINKLVNEGIAVYDDISNAVSQFQSALNIDLLNLNSFDGYIAGLKAIIPPIRIQTTTESGQKIIGLQTQINEKMQQFQQFVVDAKGKFQEFQTLAIQEMRGAINEALQVAGDATGLSNLLSDKGITVTQDGPGAIFEDALGNRIVDFSKGIGPIGETLGAVADTQQTFDSIKGLITAPISGNQALAIADFAKSIGVENFADSNVLQALNDGKYSEVARLMQGWVLAPEAPGEQPVVQESLKGQRENQASLFQTPDEVDTGPGENIAAGELSAAQLAEIRNTRRDEYINSLN